MNFSIHCHLCFLFDLCHGIFDSSLSSANCICLFKMCLQNTNTTPTLSSCSKNCSSNRLFVFPIEDNVCCPELNVNLCNNLLSTDLMICTGTTFLMNSIRWHSTQCTIWNTWFCTVDCSLNFRATLRDNVYFFHFVWHLFSRPYAL